MESNREAELIADIEALQANRDEIVRERNKFLEQRNELLDALAAAEARDEENQSFAEVERLYKSAGTDIKSEFDYEYYRRLKQRAAIAKVTGSAS